jgi:D-glycero-alpha-D-manno-heptose-7-phosphate kinase
MQIVSRAPTRIDLAGGTLDLWPLYLLHEEALTINVAIDIYTSARIMPLAEKRIELISKDQKSSVKAEDLHSLGSSNLPLLARLVQFFKPAQGFILETNSMAPAGSGLGGSSALAIAVAGALNQFTQRGFSKEELVGIARDTEAQVLGIPTGEQDYYAAMYGGLHAWRFGVGSVKHETFDVPPAEIEKRLLLYYSGVPRNSGINNWQVFKNRIDQDANTIQCLQKIRDESSRLNESLLRKDWNTFHNAISEEWQARKRLVPTITTPEIEEIMEVTGHNGAFGGKVCGAGGGGCLFVTMEPEARDRIYELSKEKGFPLLEFHAVDTGLTVTEE